MVLSHICSLCAVEQVQMSELWRLVVERLQMRGSMILCLTVDLEHKRASPGQIDNIGPQRGERNGAVVRSDVLTELCTVAIVDV